MGHAQDDERVGLGVLDELLVGPGVDRAAAVKVDVRAQDAAKARRTRPLRRHPGSPAPFASDEKLLELGPQRTDGRRVRAARQRGGPPARFAIRLVKRGERRPLDDHRGIEPADQVFELVEREKEPGLAQHPCLDLDQRRLAVEMPDDVMKAVERDENRLDTTPVGSWSNTKTDPGARRAEA